MSDSMRHGPCWMDRIHDIGKVARTISAVKAELEAQLDAPLSEVCIAAAGVC